MNQKDSTSAGHGKLSDFDARIVRRLQQAIHGAVRILALLMVVVIWYGVANVVYVLYQRISANSFILATFGAFMAVLIAIEIFINIVSYLRENSIQLRNRYCYGLHGHFA